jgi:hypoxanthine phosphoribosyltransferase
VATAPGPTLGDVVVGSAAIQQRVRDLARRIDATYAGAEQPLVLVCVLKGSVMFTADLSRAITVPLVFDFVACRSYGAGIASSGAVELIKDVSMPLRDRDVLLVEDIIDTGLTTAFLVERLAGHHPRSLRLVALLSKNRPRIKQVEIDFNGFNIPDRFVVGYGLDIAERHRNLPDVRLIEEG